MIGIIFTVITLICELHLIEKSTACAEWILNGPSQAKKCLEHAQTVQIQIILHMRKVSSWARLFKALLA